jgi:DNA-binding transcriptional MerR regulator
LTLHSGIEFTLQCYRRKIKPSVEIGILVVISRVRETLSIEANELIKIGELAKHAHLAVGTIRYYESLGLIVATKRSESGYRYYDKGAIEQLLFIKKAQHLNFSLTEIQQLITIRNKGQAPCSKVRQLLQQKINILAEQIEHLTSLKTELETYQERWQNREINSLSQEEICPLIEELPSIIDGK